MHAKRFAIAFVALCALTLAFAPTAAAHKTTYTTDGKIKIVWGFLNEPAVTWTKTGIDIILTDNATGAPITGAADTVEAHLKHGEDEIHLEDLAGRFGAPGSYTQAITLTKAGLYTLNLHGTINGSAVDMDIPAAHEVEGIEATFFPDASSPFEAGDSAEIDALKARVAALEAKAQTQSSTPANVTPQVTTTPVPLGAMLVALGIVAAALLVRRRNA